MFETSKLLREYFWIVKGVFCTQVIRQIFDNEKRIFVFAGEQEMLYGHGIKSVKLKSINSETKFIATAQMCIFVLSESYLSFKFFLYLAIKWNQ